MAKTTTRAQVREIARKLTLENPRVLERLVKECESGMVPVPIFIALLAYGWGVPKLTLEVEPGAGLLNFQTRHPLGYDPLNPDTPMTKIIEATYGVLPAPAPATDEAAPGPAAAAAAPPAPAQARPSIVPRPSLLPEGKGGPQEPEKPATRRRKAAPPPPEDDGTSTLHVEGVD